MTMAFLFMEDQLAIVPFAVYPILAAIWMVLRRHVMKQVQEEKVKTANDLVKGAHARALRSCLRYEDMICIYIISIIPYI